MNKGTFWLLVIIVVFLSLSTYQLRELPGEWFGDISILHEEVLDILKNPLDWKFNLSAGPVYHHLVAILAAVYGTRYETYKVASVLAGIAGLVFMYLLGKELGGERLGLLTAGVGAVSFWYLVWARLGSSPQSLAPVLTAASGWLGVRWWRTGKWRDLVAAEMIACLAFWTYPAVYTLPFIPILVGGWKLVSTYHVKKRSFKNTRRSWWGAVVVLLVALGLFGLSIKKQPSLFLKGYIGEKVFGYNQGIGYGVRDLGLIQKTIINFGDQLRMFIDKGDGGFRINVANKPHLDPVCRILFFGGLFWWLWGKQWRGKRALVLIPFVLLLLPASAPNILPGEIPSAARTFGVFPYVAFLVALGIEWLLGKRGRWGQWGMVGLLLVVGILNVQQYFVVYTQGLPNHNSPYGLYVAEWLDTLPEEVVVKLAGCCWGEAGIAEPKGIYYVMEKQAGRENIVHDYPFVDECSDFKPGVEYAVVFDPRDTVLIEKLAGCFDTKVQTGYEDTYGQLTFVGVRGKIGDSE